MTASSLLMDTLLPEASLCPACTLLLQHLSCKESAFGHKIVVTTNKNSCSDKIYAHIYFVLHSCVLKTAILITGKSKNNL